MDCGLSQTGHLVQEVVVGVLRNGVGLGQGQVTVGSDLGLRPQLMADPPNPDGFDGLDPLTADTMVMI